MEQTTIKNMQVDAWSIYSDRVIVCLTGNPDGPVLYTIYGEVTSGNMNSWFPNSKFLKSSLELLFSLKDDEYLSVPLLPVGTMFYDIGAEYSHQVYRFIFHNTAMQILCPLNEMMQGYGLLFDSCGVSNVTISFAIDAACRKMDKWIDERVEQIESISSFRKRKEIIDNLFLQAPRFVS